MFIAIVVFGIVAVVLDILILSVTMMVLSAFLHNNWWEAIPVLDFWPALLIGILLEVFVSPQNVSGTKTDIAGVISKVVLCLAIVPFLAPWVIDQLNNDLIPVLPDISYGTVMVFTLISLGIALVKGAITRFFEGVGEGISDSV